VYHPSSGVSASVLTPKVVLAASITVAIGRQTCYLIALVDREIAESLPNGAVSMLITGCWTALKRGSVVVDVFFGSMWGTGETWQVSGLGMAA
jgi:hypothetical protein